MPPAVAFLWSFTWNTGKMLTPDWLARPVRRLQNADAMKKRPQTRSKKKRQPTMSRAARSAPSPVVSEKSRVGTPIEQTIIDMAETMGRLVGEGELRWKQWVKQPHAVRDSLMTIRDKATHLLLEMRTSAAAGFAQASDDADGDRVRVPPAGPAPRRKRARSAR
ncbi:MAG TPA: hypothetical protein VH701_11800 [Vicinamibacterales bacterium]